MSFRPLPIALVAAAAIGPLAVSPANAAAKSRVRQCDATVQRVVPAGQSASVLQAATKISTRGVSCRRARNLISASIVQVGQSSPAPPEVCCDGGWYANDADWWRRNGWRVEHGLGADPKAANGARFVVRRGKGTIRFTRWA